MPNTPEKAAGERIITRLTRTATACGITGSVDRRIAAEFARIIVRANENHYLPLLREVMIFVRDRDDGTNLQQYVMKRLKAEVARLEAATKEDRT